MEAFIYLDSDPLLYSNQTFFLLRYCISASEFFVLVGTRTEVNKLQPQEIHAILLPGLGLWSKRVPPGQAEAQVEVVRTRWSLGTAFQNIFATPHLSLAQSASSH